MVLSREQAVARALASSTNIPNTCQAWTRNLYKAPSVGDWDGDGSADAEDGWKSEPAKWRHTDRKPPRGTPIAWAGGPNDNGHRAISLGPNSKGVYKIRSTDAGGRGKVATVDLDWVEREWGLRYLGWSESISGQLIPKGSAPTPKPPAKPPAKAPVKTEWTRGADTDEAIRRTRRARNRATGKRRTKLQTALDAFKKIKPWKK